MKLSFGAFSIVLGVFLFSACDRNTRVTFAPGVLASPSTRIIKELNSAGFRRTNAGTETLVDSAVSSASHSCGRLSGSSEISTLSLPSGIVAPRLPIDFAKAIVVRCDYTDNWFVNRRIWFALPLIGTAFADRGPSFTTASQAEIYAFDPQAFTQRQNAAISLQTHRNDEAAALYRYFCTRPPFTTGRVDWETETKAVITCYAVLPNGLVDTGHKRIQRVTLH